MDIIPYRIYMYVRSYTLHFPHHPLQQHTQLSYIFYMACPALFKTRDSLNFSSNKRVKKHGIYKLTKNDDDPLLPFFTLLLLFLDWNGMPRIPHFHQASHRLLPTFFSQVSF